MTILVCGGRNYGHYRRLDAVLWQLYEQQGIRRLIHGDARGADRLAKRWAQQLGIVTTAYQAQWDRYGRAAGVLRNQRMLDEEPAIGLVVAFPGGTGTADMVQRAAAKGILVWPVDWEPVPALLETVRFHL